MLLSDLFAVRITIINMNLRDLQYLIAVAEHRHFGKAADACFVSQPTLSTQIKKLEEELNVTLIERNNKNVLLTDIGQQIIDKAREIHHSVQDLRELAAQHNDPQAGILRLGIIPTLAPYLLAHVVPHIQQEFPKLKLMLYELQTKEILKRLPIGDLDAAILALPIDNPSLYSHPLFTEPFFAAVPNQHELARHRAIQLHEFSQYSVLLLEDGHCLRDQALDLCRKVSATEFEGFRATSLETLRQMVGSGYGVTFMPALATKQDSSFFSNNKSIRYIPFEETEPNRKIAICYRNSSYRGELINSIGDLIKACAENLLK